jgi:hypothetical protein
MPKFAHKLTAVVDGLLSMNAGACTTRKPQPAAALVFAIAKRGHTYMVRGRNAMQPAELKQVNGTGKLSRITERKTSEECRAQTDGRRATSRKQNATTCS